MSKTQVVTGVSRLSYASIWEPKETPSGQMKYSVCVLIPKKDKQTIKAIEAAIEAAYQDGLVKKWAGKKAGVKMDVLRDGDEENEDGELKGPEFRGMYYINASGMKAPIVLDRERNPVLDKTEVYSGCWANVAINFYPYAVDGAKGIAAGLNAIRKVKDDESLGGELTVDAARSAFDELEEDDI